MPPTRCRGGERGRRRRWSCRGGGPDAASRPAAPTQPAHGERAGGAHADAPAFALIRVRLASLRARGTQPARVQRESAAGAIASRNTVARGYAPGKVWLWCLLRILVGLPSRGAAKAPTRAPEATAATTSTPAAKRQQLWCEPGGHSWSRPAVPG